MSDFQSELREILDGYTVVEQGGKAVEEQFGIYLEYEQFPEVIAAILQLINKVAGEDEPVPNDILEYQDDDQRKYWQNKLRAELRQAFGLTKEEKG